MREFEDPFPKKVKKNKKKIETARLLSKSLIYAFAIFGLVFIMILFALFGMLRSQGKTVVNVPKSAILTVDFDMSIPETPNNDLVADLTGLSGQNFFRLIRDINIAASDERIKAMVGKVSVSSLGLAQIQELRQAVLNFRSSGKKAYIYAPGFGSFGGGTKEYYLASIFDEIVMAPNSEAGITGIGFEIPFFKTVLDKLGIKPEFYARYEFKTAMDSFTQSKISKPFKAELDKLGKGLFNRMVFDIAHSRNLEQKKLVDLIDNAPLSSEEALDNKLIDKIAFKQDFFDEIEKKYDAESINVIDYDSVIEDNPKGTKSIALLIVEGVIAEGESAGETLQEEVVTGSDTVLAQLKEISEDENVQALVLRINSPGGGYNAANEIWHGIEQLKQDKKIPVVVSMGDYAASGGYFIAIAGDKILADPSTITGSIGVLGGKMVLQGLWQKLGVNWERIAFGDNAGILSANAAFSKREKQLFNKSLDVVYSDFTSKVAKARNIDIKQLDKLARGRVWLGEQAVENKLADNIGSLENALNLAQTMAQIQPTEPIRIEVFPKEKTLQEKLQEFIASGRSVSAPKLSQALQQNLRQLKIFNRLQYNAILPPFFIVM